VGHVVALFGHPGQVATVLQVR